MVGIDISDRSIKVAELSEEAKPRVLTVGWTSLKEGAMRLGVVRDVAMVADGLRQAIARATIPLSSKVVIASIPERQSFVRVLDMPAMEPVEMDEAIRWAVRQHIPFDSTRVYLDWQFLDTPARLPHYRQVLVGASQKDVVDPLLAVFDTTDLNVVALELEAQSIVRSLLPREANDVRGVLLVDIGAVSTNVVFFDRGTMRFTTNVMQGGDGLTQYLAQRLQVSLEEAAEFKALYGVARDSNEGVATVLREVVLSLVHEVERAVRSIMTAQESAAEKIRALLLSGGSANLPGIEQLFEEVFSGIPVQFGNPWTNLAAPRGKSEIPLSKDDMLHFTTAFGLALRRHQSF